MITKRLGKAFYCALLLGLVRVVALPLIALRLFGCLFFALTGWPLVPALVLIALLVASYLASVLFHGWSDAQLRLHEGQEITYDIMEAVVIFSLTACCLVSRRRPTM